MIRNHERNNFTSSSQGWIQSSSSDLHKSLKFFPNLISQLFIAVDGINYLPCLIVYYEINKTNERLFRRSHSKPSPSRAKWTSHRSRGFVLCWSFENHAGTTGQSFYLGGSDWRHGSFHKSLKTHFDWSEPLALSCELLKLDCDWLFRSQTTVQTIKRSLSLRSPFVLVEFVNSVREDKNTLIYKPWFEAIQFVGRRTVLSMILASFSRKSGELFDFPVSVECSNSKRDFVWSWLKRFAWLVYSKFLDGAFCLPCVLFGVQCGRNSNKLDKLWYRNLSIHEFLFVSLSWCHERLHKRRSVKASGNKFLSIYFWRKHE